MSTRPIIDAGPGLNFLSANKERLLIAVLGPLSAPETVRDEVLRKSAHDSRFQAAAKTWRTLRTRRWPAADRKDPAAVALALGTPVSSRRRVSGLEATPELQSRVHDDVPGTDGHIEQAGGHAFVVLRGELGGQVELIGAGQAQDGHAVAEFVHERPGRDQVARLVHAAKEGDVLGEPGVIEDVSVRRAVRARAVLQCHPGVDLVAHGRSLAPRFAA